MVREKVVYFLGAGFSAPLGLPVMSNFLEKSKELYYGNRMDYEHFKEVLSTIKDISIATKYFDADIYNIEEILSILEMTAQLRGTRIEEPFLNYIADVISYYTPPISLDKPQPCRAKTSRSSSRAFEVEIPWHDTIFGNDDRWHGYASL